MGVITDIQTRLNTLKESSDISTIEYDRLDSINEDAENNYPMCIWRVTGSTDNDIRKTKHYTQYTIDFYLSDIYYSGDTDTIPEKKDYLDETLMELITSLPDYDQENRQNTFELVGSSAAEYGWEQHNDELVVVKRTVTLQAFKCIDRI